MIPRRTLTIVLAAAALAACGGEQAPVSGPGTMTVTLMSPNGSEGAAVLNLLGDGIGQVSSTGANEVYSFSGSGDSQTRVVLISQAGGDLSFQVAVPDTTQPPAYVIEEVAGPDDALRGLTGYELEFRR